MVEIKKINALSLAKVLAFISIFFGLILGMLGGFLSFIYGSIIGSIAFGSYSSAMFGILGFILVPIILGTIGFIFGLIIAWLYNIFSWLVGGIKIEFSEEDFD